MSTLSIKPAELSAASQQLASLGGQCAQGKLSSSDGFGESSATASTIERLFADALGACGESFKQISSSIDAAIKAYQDTDSKRKTDFDDVNKQDSGTATPSSPPTPSPSASPSRPSPSPSTLPLPPSPKPGPSPSPSGPR